MNTSLTSFRQVYERFLGMFGNVPRHRSIFLVGAVLIVALVVAGWLFRQNFLSAQSSFATAEACKPIRPGEEFEPSNQHDLSGELKRDSYFENGEEYHIEENATFTIPKGIILIIEPGTRVKFGRGATLIVDGVLLACGSGSRRILFTADAESGRPGYWQGVVIRSSEAEAVIGHATFEFGGQDSHAIIQVEDGSLSLEDVRFDSNQYYALSTRPDLFPRLRSPFEVENGPQGWEIRGGELSEDFTWSGDHPLVINGELKIKEKATLNLLPGTQVEFLPDSKISVYGKVSAKGTINNHIQITAAHEVAEEAKTSSGDEETWTGLLFIGKESEAELTFVDFRYEQEKDQ